MRTQADRHRLGGKGRNKPGGRIDTDSKLNFVRSADRLKKREGMGGGGREMSSGKHLLNQKIMEYFKKKLYRTKRTLQ